MLIHQEISRMLIKSLVCLIIIVYPQPLCAMEPQSNIVAENIVSDNELSDDTSSSLSATVSPTDPYEEDDDGATSFHEAAQKNDIQLLESLKDYANYRDLPNNQNQRPLHYAASHDNSEMAKRLIAMKLNINEQDHAGRTALHYAPSADMIDVLVLSGIDLDCHGPNKMGQTALHRAAERGRTSTVARLLGYGADAEVRDERGMTPLHYAAHGKNNKDGVIKDGVIQALRARKVNPGLLDNQGRMPIHLAARAGRLNAVLMLMNAGSPIGVPNGGLQPIHCAAEGGYCNIVQLFIEHGAKIDISDGDGMLPLHYAAMGGHYELLPLLCRPDLINYINERGQTPLKLALLANSTESVKYLLEHGANQNAGLMVMSSTNFGEFTARPSLLHDAIELGNSEVVRLLCGYGASINYGYVLKDVIWRPLQRAAFRNNSAVIAELLTAGADPTLIDNFGNTPLHWASKREIAEQFVKDKALLEVQNSDGKTPLHCASQQGYTDVVELLLENGAAVDAIDRDNKTPLHWAGNARIVELLMQYSADITALAKDHLTPLHTAVANQHPDVVRQLSCYFGTQLDVVDENGVTALGWARLLGFDESADILEEAEKERGLTMESPITPSTSHILSPETV